VLSNKEVEQYLERINYSGDTTVDFSTLQTIHKAHMYSIPFENLDIPLGKQINLSISSLFKKLILKRRGGFCYELNYAFSALLSSLGFNVKLLSARVFHGSTYGKAFAHMVLLVEVQEEKVIADVGFGDGIREPLLLNSKPVKQVDTIYKIEQQNNEHILFQKRGNLDWTPRYIFSLSTYDIDAFGEMCEWQQTSPESNFSKKSVCSTPTEMGRKTISNGRFIVTTEGARTEYSINSEVEYRQILKQHFHISLPQDIGLDKLLVANYSHNNQIQPSADTSAG